MKSACVLAALILIQLASVGGAQLPVAEAPVTEAPVVIALRDFLAQPPATRGELSSQGFAQQALTREEARATHGLLWADREQQLRQERAGELQAGQIVEGDKLMPFIVKEFGAKPAQGWSAVISMHGGGGAPAAVNDKQWENQKRLYKLEEGLYVVPRAPTNTWNLWHESHIDTMFDRLIEDLIVLRGVNPNRVYLTGYSAGGDGVYQLAPRMADRFAAAAMMAGHPNEASPLGLRNLPFAIHVGENDGMYNRNTVARQWGDQLQALHAADPQGYESYAKLHAGRGHWMNGEDAEAIAWMWRHTRNPLPSKIVWRQDDVIGTRFLLVVGIARFGLAWAGGHSDA